jgi:hypothetical protein
VKLPTVGSQSIEILSNDTLARFQTERFRRRYLRQKLDQSQDGALVSTNNANDKGESMDKVHKFRYSVSLGENITIRVTPENFGSSLSSVEMTLDDGTVDLPNSGTASAPVFAFTVTKPAGETHRVFTEFSFQDDSPDQAQYNVDISGQNDVGCPCGFTIAKSDLDKSPDIKFDVKGDE